ncbi:MAG: NADH-quinone oxidoreductase subunit NuoK [Bdellovibrionota bacterium]
MSVGLHHYLLLSALLFVVGTVGVITRRNAIVVLMSIELMLNGVNLSLAAFSRYWGDGSGHALVIFSIAVAAAEAAVGLALLIAVFRNRQSVDLEDLNLLKG